MERRGRGVRWNIKENHIQRIYKRAMERIRGAHCAVSKNACSIHTYSHSEQRTLHLTSHTNVNREKGKIITFQINAWHPRNNGAKIEMKTENENTLCERYPGLGEDVWNLLPQRKLAVKETTSERMRARARQNKVMKKSEQKTWNSILFFFIFTSFYFIFVRANHILGYWWLRPSEWGNVFARCAWSPCMCTNLRTVFAISWWLHAWFISTVYRLHERCAKYRCAMPLWHRASYMYECWMHARTEMISSIFFLFKLFKSNKWKWLENILSDLFEHIEGEVGADNNIFIQFICAIRLFRTSQRKYIHLMGEFSFIRFPFCTLLRAHLYRSNWKWAHAVHSAFVDSHKRKCAQGVAKLILYYVSMRRVYLNHRLISITNTL